MVAHRGDQGEATENTLPAFVAAAAAGARYIECDIQFGRDMQPVVFHDHHLGRLFGRPDLRLAMHLDTVSGSTMPGFESFAPLLLADLLGWLDGEPQLTLFLEIKPNVLSRHRPGVIVRLLAPLLNRPSAERIVIISQSAAMLEACARHLPQRRGWVASVRRRPRCGLHSVFLDKRQTGSLAGWKAEGVRVAVYTVNDAAEATSLFDAGADLVETNYFARLRRDLENGC
ncbi:MAG TPA: glycerophosphodiester phosphodiesterase family protein [Mariprofundaceae bacterium]|nr:glycerophosphodiester phosphodiesterase family protein [Mariprofundaceae bacterium]